MIKELVDFFNNLNGKTLTPEELEQLDNSTGGNVAKQMIEAIKGDQHTKSGAYKTCSFFGDAPVFAMLKSKQVCSKASQMFVKNKANQIIRLNNKLVTGGARIARLYSIFYADKRYVEIQQAIKGEPIAINNLSNFAKKVIGRRIDSYFTTDIDPLEKKKLGDALFEYNYNQQQLMLSLPQSAFDKLFKTYVLLNRRNIRVDDNHCENLLVGKKGFTLIDLDYGKMVEHNKDYKNKQTDNKVAHDFIFPFSYTSFYTPFLTMTQIKKLEDANVEILKRLIDAISNNKVVINAKKDMIDDVIFGMVGIDNAIDKANYLFQSQIELRQKQGLPPDGFVKYYTATPKRK
mgnify:FL=1